MPTPTRSVTTGFHILYYTIDGEIAELVSAAIASCFRQPGIESHCIILCQREFTGKTWIKTIDAAIAWRSTEGQQQAEAKLAELGIDRDLHIRGGRAYSISEIWETGNK